MQREEAWTLVDSARVATLATIRPDGTARLVPCVFARQGSTMHLPVDAKPKSTRALARLADVRREPRVALLVQNWNEDWTRLWWVRLDGRARLAVGEELDAARTLLVDRYPQYRDGGELDPVVSVDVAGWRGWRASDA